TNWVHLELLGCLTKFGAKRAELVLKFVPRSCVRIFHNECTRSIPLDPKLMFCCVSYHLGPFGCLTKLVQNEPNDFKSSGQGVASKFFSTNTPDGTKHTKT